MGQTIEVEAAEVGGVLIFTTDRSITGQDGASYATAAEANDDLGIPGQLASRLYAADDSLTSVFVASNQIVAARADGWGEDAIATLSGVISDFFLFYPGE
jgi:hypothetical protein